MPWIALQPLELINESHCKKKRSLWTRQWIFIGTSTKGISRTNTKLVIIMTIMIDQCPNNWALPLGTHHFFEYISIVSSMSSEFRCSVEIRIAWTQIQLFLSHNKTRFIVSIKARGKGESLKNICGALYCKMDSIQIVPLLIHFIHSLDHCHKTFFILLLELEQEEG